MTRDTDTSAYIIDGVRTPFGRYGGALSAMRPDDMAASTIKALQQRIGFDGKSVDEVVLGCSNQGGEDSRNVARTALLLAGLPDETPGHTVNRLCASGLAAIASASRMIRCGEADMLLAGGVESMSRAPYVTAKPAKAFQRTVETYDSTLGWRFPNKALLERIGDDSLGDTADNVASEHAITREDSDAYALRSQQRYAAALARGFFDDEIFPVTVPGRRPVTVERDEHPRPDTTLEKLAQLRPLAQGGVVTAGNASGVNDGACVLAVASRAGCPMRSTASRSRAWSPPPPLACPRG